MAKDAGVDRKKEGSRDWLCSNQVNHEQYLLGKRIDRQVDPLLASEDRERQALASGPGALFIGPDTAGTSADLAVKVKEDPLFLIKKKEEEARKQLVSNPVKMKQLQELLAQEKSTKHKSKNKRDSLQSPHRSKKSHKDKKRKRSPSPLSSLPSTQCQTQRTHTYKSTFTPHKTRPHRSGLSREELERRRKEMMTDAESHGREREQRLRRLEQDRRKEEEESSTSHSQDFLQPLRVQSMAAAGSVQERIQCSIGSVQRTRAALEKHFLHK